MPSKATWWDWIRSTWPDWLNLSVGLWMILSAFVPEFSGAPPGPLASGLSGLAVTLASAAALRNRMPWKEATNLALGLWLVAAPWALGLHAFNPFWNFVGDGLFLAFHAAYQMARAAQRREGLG